MQTAEDGRDDIADPEPADVGNPGSDSGDSGDLPWSGFREAAQAAVETLHAQLGLDLWVVTQVQHDTQRTLAAAPAGTLPAGASLPWAQTLCSRMVAGAPRPAPALRTVPAYAAARTGPAASVGAYLGVPLRYPDGQLFGTLCGLALQAQPPALADQLPLVELVARLLASLLHPEQTQTGSRSVAEACG